MAVKYTLPFSTNNGSSIEYELDIIDDGFTGTATNLKGQANPIEIEWKKDDDVYTPVIGSKANINLLIEDGDTIDDFNAGTFYQYEVRLRYVGTGNSRHDVWRGWIQPNDGNENVGSYPLSVSYIATDHLGSN